MAFFRKQQLFKMVSVAYALNKIKIHIILHSFFERVKVLYIAGGYQSGQLGQTVNLLTYVFVGSNPAPPTSVPSNILDHDSIV